MLFRHVHVFRTSDRALVRASKHLDRLGRAEGSALHLVLHLDELLERGKRLGFIGSLLAVLSTISELLGDLARHIGLLLTWHLGARRRGYLDILLSLDSQLVPVLLEGLGLSDILLIPYWEVNVKVIHLVSCFSTLFQNSRVCIDTHI